MPPAGGELLLALIQTALCAATAMLLHMHISICHALKSFLQPKP
jgi:hypothetical protein